MSEKLKPCVVAELRNLRAGIEASKWHDIDGERMKRILVAETAIARIDEALSTRPLSMTGELAEELRLWIMLVNEGVVPRYTVTPGAALNTVVTSTKRLLARHDAALAAIQSRPVTKRQWKKLARQMREGAEAARTAGHDGAIGGAMAEKFFETAAAMQDCAQRAEREAWRHG